MTLNFKQQASAIWEFEHYKFCFLDCFLRQLDLYADLGNIQLIYCTVDCCRIFCTKCGYLADSWLFLFNWKVLERPSSSQYWQERNLSKFCTQKFIENAIVHSLKHRAIFIFKSTNKTLNWLFNLLSNSLQNTAEKKWISDVGSRRILAVAAFSLMTTQWGGDDVGPHIFPLKASLGL